MQQQWDVVTPGLHIRDGVWVGGILLGSVLMAALALLRLFSHGRPLHAVGALATVLLVCAVCWFGKKR